MNGVSSHLHAERVAEDLHEVLSEDERIVRIEKAATGTVCEFEQGVRIHESTETDGVDFYVLAQDSWQDIVNSRRPVLQAVAEDQVNRAGFAGDSNP